MNNEIIKMLHVAAYLLCAAMNRTECKVNCPLGPKKYSESELHQASSPNSTSEKVLYRGVM